MISALITLAGSVILSICQGLAVIGTAYIVARLLKLEHWAWKLALSCLSYAAWFTAAVVIWSARGGGFAFMEGGAIFFGMAASSFVGSTVVMTIWLAFEAQKRRFDHV